MTDEDPATVTAEQARFAALIARRDRLLALIAERSREPEAPINKRDHLAALVADGKGEFAALTSASDRARARGLVCPKCGAPTPSPYGLDLSPFFGAQLIEEHKANFCARCGADLRPPSMAPRRLEDLPGYEPDLPRPVMLHRICETLEKRIAYDTALLKTVRVLEGDEEKRPG